MQVNRPPRKPTGIRRHLFRAPILMYRVGLGRLLGSRFVLIKHVGRRTGRPRETVVEVVSRDNDDVIVAAGFGSGSDWYRNLLAHSDTTIQIGRRRRDVTAQRVAEPERVAAMLQVRGEYDRSTACAQTAEWISRALDGRPRS